ncbi:hypothetical protein [uncultured Shewanella sp.]|uniref:hypothetical protein n=1 Tax=uncultured Shewanella sp. TaxID=173975 RepID=UPI002615C89C|nr:hypothetical protein [uncultured Shewanella sp.]
MNSRAKNIQLGLDAADSAIFQSSKIWAKYSDEKADVAHILIGMICQLAQKIGSEKAMRALAIGSADEPQFRLLEAAFRGGLYLFDIDNKALDTVNNKITRQFIKNVQTVQGDFVNVFSSAQSTQQCLQSQLGHVKFDLITLHHCLYYCNEATWSILLGHLLNELLANHGKIHILLMAVNDEREDTTEALYRHFMRQFYGEYCPQNVRTLYHELQKNEQFSEMDLHLDTREVKFYTHDFAEYMAVVWMILLYPHVHQYSLEERKDITEYVFDHLWSQQKPLIQLQDSLIISR